MENILVLLIRFGYYFVFFVIILLIVWIIQKLYIRNREMINKERMALIEKGVYDFPREESMISLHRYLFWGLVLLGLGIAFIIGDFVSNIGGILILILGLIFLFPALGMLLFYKIQSKKEKKKEEKTRTNSEAANRSE